MRCLMAVWSSHRGDGCWEHGWIRPPHSLLLYKHSSGPVMDETGWSLPRPYLWEQKTLSPRLSVHGAVNAITCWGEEKDSWHWNELQACNSSSGDGKWLQFVIWTYQRWKRDRPPELSWACLLFQSWKSSSTDRLCWLWVKYLTDSTTSTRRTGDRTSHEWLCLLNSLHWSDRAMETFNQSTTVNWRAHADNWQTLQFTDFLWMPHAEYWWLQHLTDVWDAVIYRCSLNVSLVQNWLMLPFRDAPLS